MTKKGCLDVVVWMLRGDRARLTLSSRAQVTRAFTLRRHRASEANRIIHNL